MARPEGLVRDTALNGTAFAIMAVGGVALNFFIAAVYGAAVLGVFNQVYALYVVAAQVAVLGLHDSVQTHIAGDEQGGEEAEITASGLGVSLLLGALVAAAAASGAELVGRVADSPALGQGLWYAAPGLGLFAVNKVLMGVLNGQRRIGAFAAAQSARVLLIVSTALGVWALQRPSVELCASFSVAELVLLPALLVAVRPRGLRLRGAWARRHLHFGLRALPNGLLAESFLRVDILMLGLLMDDHSVGIYSFAAMFAEGLYQVGVTVRVVVNPRLVLLLRASDRGELAALVRRAMGVGVGAYLPTAAAVLLILPWLAPLFPEGLVGSAHGLLQIVALGLLLYAPFVPLDFCVLQSGRPGLQSILMTGNIAMNAALNLALVPSFGLWGAAVATATAWTLSAVTLNVVVARGLGVPWGLVGLAVRGR